MTRFGVMKHLRVLEDAGLVVTRRSGREKLHFLNPVPIRLIHDRWIDKYTERQVSALADLKNELEEDGMTTMTETNVTTQVYRVYIKATPQAIWDAITKPEWTERYGYGGRGEYDLRPGGSYRGYASEEMQGARRAGGRRRRRGHRGRPAAQARPDLAHAHGPRHGGGGVHAPHVRDRGARGRRVEADGDPRARGRAADGGADAPASWKTRARAAAGAGCSAA